MGYSFDSEYVRRLTDGDAAVVEHFYDHFGRLMFFKLRRKSQDHDTIDEVRQETFLRVLTTLRTGPGLRDPRRLGGFVHSVCNNVFREHVRKVTRMPSIDKSPDDVADPCEDVHSQLDRDELQEQVRAVLDELSESDRYLLRQVLMEECDREEVCRSRQVSRDYLRVLVHRAKERFRSLYRQSMARQCRTFRRTPAAGGPRVADES